MRMLTAGSQGVANLALADTRLEALVAGFELVLAIQGHTVTPDPNFWAIVHSGEVQVGRPLGQLSRLGTARPASPLRIQTGPQAMGVSWEFRLPLSREHLAAIEDLRDAGDLQFQVTLSGEGGPNGRDQLAPVHEVFVLSVARSAWIASINAAKAMDILLLEIPMPFVDPPTAGRELTDMLRRAQGLFLNGDYPETLTCCRSALEALGTLQARDTRWPDAALDDLKASRSRDLTKDQRLRSIEAALMQLTHLGAHPTETKIDRRDAKLALALTAGILAFEIA